MRGSDGWDRGDGDAKGGSSTVELILQGRVRQGMPFKKSQMYLEQLAVGSSGGGDRGGWNEVGGLE